MSELKTSVKTWERIFEAKNNRKPTSTDAKADKEFWSLYLKYRAERQQRGDKDPSHSHKAEYVPINGPTTPRKDRSRPSQDSDTENDEATPTTNRITEVFPTPQLRGRALSIFDVELNVPLTPRHEKASSDRGSPRGTGIMTTTPDRAPREETPQSKRTPDYFLKRTQLFAGAMKSTSAAPQLNFDEPVLPAESPLVKRKLFRTKSVRDIVHEASVLRSKNPLDNNDEPVNGTPMTLEFTDGSGETDGLNHENTIAPVIDDRPAKGHGSRKPKRQTKRVIMRPVDRENAHLDTKKPTGNYVRLKINQNNKKFLKRRKQR